jgi:predicted NBD/HSP70 family sugar kinase
VVVSASSPVIPRWPGLPDTERLVLRELLLHGSQSRVRIAEKLGLSRTSLTRTTRTLIDAGLIVEGPAQALGTRGRPAEILQLRPEAAHFAGIKLTADTMYMVLTDMRGRAVAESVQALPSRDVADVVALIARSIPAPPRGAGPVAGLGIAVAGDVTESPEGAVLRHSNFLGWDAVALARLVTEATMLPATVVNDVHALTGAQHWFGSGPPRSSLVVFGIGAGIGSGVVIAGELHQGAHGRAGRVGHGRIGGQGRPCENGHTDCIHSFVTIPAIEHNAGVGAGEYDTAIVRARAGEGRAAAAVRDAARAVGAVIAEAVNAFDPDAVALMGEGLDMVELAPASLRASLMEFLEQGEPDDISILRPHFDFGLYARGAAVAAMRELLSA